MCKAMVPDRCVDAMMNIDYEALRDEGYKYAFLDFDNTMAEDHAKEPSQLSFAILEKLQTAGFSCCLVSNAKSTRSADVAKLLGIPCVSYANKPSPSGLLKAMKLISAEKEKSIMFGDQVFTDIIAGNRAGICTYLVTPVSKKEVFYVRLKRPFEKIVRFFCRF